MEYIWISLSILIGIITMAAGIALLHRLLDAPRMQLTAEPAQPPLLTLREIRQICRQVEKVSRKSRSRYGRPGQIRRKAW